MVFIGGANRGAAGAMLFASFNSDEGGGNTMGVWWFVTMYMDMDMYMGMEKDSKSGQVKSSRSVLIRADLI